MSIGRILAGERAWWHAPAYRASCGSRSTISRNAAAAIAAWPYEIPPSLGGSRSGTSTRARRARARRRRARAAAGSGTRRRSARRSPSPRRRRSPMHGRDRRRRRRRRGSAPRRRPARRRRSSSPTIARIAARGSSVPPSADRRQLVRRRAPAPADHAARLELDRRLALVADLRRGSRTAPRPRRTAAPCSTSRGDTLGLATDLRHRVPAQSRSTSRAQRRGTAAAARRTPRQPGERHPPRLADRRRAARHPHRAQRAGALEAAQVADQQLAAPDRAVGRRSRCRRRSRRPPAPATPCSARQAARWAWWCWTPTSAHAVALERVLRSTGSPGCRSWATSSRRDREQPLEVRDPLAEGAAASRSARGRRCGARPRRARPWRRRTCSSARRRRPAAGAAAASGSGSARRHIAARAAQQQRPPAVADAHGADDRVVGAGLDRAVVDAGTGRRSAPGVASASSSR